MNCWQRPQITFVCRWCCRDGYECVNCWPSKLCFVCVIVICRRSFRMKILLPAWLQSSTETSIPLYLCGAYKDKHIHFSKNKKHFVENTVVPHIFFQSGVYMTLVVEVIYFAFGLKHFFITLRWYFVVYKQQYL